MANYGIIDTGYAKSTTTSGTKFSKTNSGSEVPVYVKSMVLTGKQNLDDQAIPALVTSGKFSQAEVNTGSVSNNNYTVVAEYKRDNATHMTALQNIFDMRTTKGVKIFYYGSTTDGYNTIPNLFGSTDSNHSSTGNYTSNTTPHIHCFVQSVTINENNGNAAGKITATIILTETS